MAIGCSECILRDIEINDLDEEVKELEKKISDLENKVYDLEQENIAYKDTIGDIKQAIKYL